eukprot:GHVN01066577.1.p1 GENE.GHVN01066577.1~~GHVN01066577.1.p1  ORF type:complete len:291 (+),score=20.05 GHVN01066577.1:40-912(+)
MEVPKRISALLGKQQNTMMLALFGASGGLAVSCLAELVGTFCLVLIMIYGSLVHSTMLPVLVGGMMSVLSYVVHKHSGAHLNPAVSSAIWLANPSELSTVASTVYISAQYAGGMAAGLVCLMFLNDSFYFQPLNGFSVSHAVAMETLCSTIVCAAGLVSTKRDFGHLNSKSPTHKVKKVDSRRGVRSALLGLATTVAMALSLPVSGACLNPAAYFGAVSAHMVLRGHGSVDWLRCAPYYIGPYAAAMIVGLLNRTIKVDSEKELVYAGDLIPIQEDPKEHAPLIAPIFKD